MAPKETGPDKACANSHQNDLTRRRGKALFRINGAKPFPRIKLMVKSGKKFKNEHDWI
jgi:hypothetical protein